MTAADLPRQNFIQSRDGDLNAFEVHEKALSLKASPHPRKSASHSQSEIPPSSRPIGDKQSAPLSSSFSILSVSYQSLCRRLTFALIEVEDVSRFARNYRRLQSTNRFVGSYAMRLDNLRRSKAISLTPTRVRGVKSRTKLLSDDIKSR